MNEFIETLLITNLLWAIWTFAIIVLIKKTQFMSNRDKVNVLYLSHIALPIVLLYQGFQHYFATESFIPVALQLNKLDVIQAVGNQSQTIEPLIPIIIGFIVLGIVYLIKNMRNLLNTHIEEIDDFTDKINTLKNQTTLKTPIKVYSSTLFKSPLSFGWLKKRIIIPQHMVKSIAPNRIVYVLLHELVHIVHHDYLKNIFQKITRILFFYNPFVHILDKMIDRYREFACDEDVLAILPNKKEYAQTLLDLHQDDLENLALAHQFLSNSNDLKERISAISSNNPRKTHKIYATKFVILTALLLIACQNNFSQLDSGSPDYIQFFDAETKPQIVKKVLPKYPEIARKAGVDGMVVIDFVVGKDGLPKNIAVLKGHPMLNEAALDAVKQYEFIPGRENGKVVDVKWRIPIRFRLKSEEKQETLYPDNWESPDGVGIRITMPYVADVKPELIHSVSPVYPKEAKEKQIEGSVLVSFVVDKNGNAAMVKAETGPKELYDAAKEAVVQYKFKPAMKDNEAINVWWRYQFDFNLNSEFVEKFESEIKPMTFNSNNQHPSKVREIYFSKNVDKLPKLINRVLPKYPEEALKKGIEGRVVVDFIVTKTGDVISVKIYDKNSSPGFNQAAIDAVSQYKFEPGMKNGKAVNVEMSIPVKFVLAD